jgi:hypothetical protein
MEGGAIRHAFGISPRRLRVKSESEPATARKNLRPTKDFCIFFLTAISELDMLYPS